MTKAMPQPTLVESFNGINVCGFGYRFCGIIFDISFLVIDIQQYYHNYCCTFSVILHRQNLITGAYL